VKIGVDDRNRCRLEYMKFHLNWYRFAVAVAKCLGGSLFCDTVYRPVPFRNLEGVAVHFSLFRYTFSEMFKF